MKDGPNIVGIAALIGDRARADVLTALMADRALTATELAGVALVAVESQGRHRYFRLADQDVAQLLESLMGVAFRTGAVRVLASPREPALRKARVCYDHLAGEVGVRIYESLMQRRALVPGADGIELTKEGKRVFQKLRIDTDALAKQKRAFCRACLDWSERRNHLAGALGAALLARIVELGWAKRARDSRVVLLTATGREALQRMF